MTCELMTLSMFKSVAGSCAGLGVAESSQSRQRGTGLRQGLSELHLRVHLQQLP